MEFEEKIVLRIKELISLQVPENNGGVITGELYMGTLNISNALFGSNSQQSKEVIALNDRVLNLPGVYRNRCRLLGNELKGILENFSKEIEAGLLKSIQLESKGEILADFLVLGKQALDDGIINVAAVLCTAAMEDTLKRFAEIKGIDVENKDLSEVINSLKAAGLIKSSQGKILKSFVNTRNKALHAEWDKIDSTSIQSIIAFVEEFIVKNY